MANWGEGDARWIVKDLGDAGRNVSGWHWCGCGAGFLEGQATSAGGRTLLAAPLAAPALGSLGRREEKNCLSWFRAQAESSLTGLAPSQPHAPVPGWTRITGVKEVKGEASVSSRKGGKKLAVYDLQLTLTWEGFDEEAEQSVKGEFKLSEFASANEEDEYVVAVTVEGKGAAHEAHRKRVAEMRAQVLALLHRIVTDMINQ